MAPGYPGSGQTDEDGIQGHLELIEIVDINSVVAAGLRNCHGERCRGRATDLLLWQVVLARFLSQMFLYV